MPRIPATPKPVPPRSFATHDTLPADGVDLDVLPLPSLAAPPTEPASPSADEAGQES